MAKMAIVVVALCLVGLSQSSVVNLTPASSNVSNEVENITERQGEERIGSLLDSLESKMVRLSGPRSNELDDLLQNLQEVKAEYKNFEESYRIGQSKMRATEEENAKLAQQIIQLLNGRRGGADENVAEVINTLKAQISKLEAENARLQQAMGCLEGPDLKKENAELKEQLQNETRQLAQALRNITRLKNDKNEMEEENSLLVNQYMALLNQHANKKSALEATIRDLSAEKQQLLDSNRNLTQTLNITSQQLQECLQANLGDKTVCTEADEELRRKTERLKQQNEELNEKLKQAQDKLEGMEQPQDITELQRQIVELKKNITKLAAQKKELDQDLDTLTKDALKLIQGLLLQNQILQSENENLSATNAQLLIDVANVTTKFYQIEKLLEECLNKKPNNVPSEADEQLRKNITELIKNNEELTAQLQNLTEQLQELQCVDDLETLHASLAEATRKISNLTEENKKLNSDYGHLLDCLIKAEDEHRKEQKDLQKLLDSVSAKSVQLSRDNAALNKTLNESLQQLEALRKTCNEKQNVTNEPVTNLPVDQLEQIIHLLQENQELIKQATNASSKANITESQLIELVNNARRLLGEKEQLRNKLNDALQQIAALSAASNGSSSNGNGAASIHGSDKSDSLPSSCAEALERAGDKAASGVQQLLLPGSGLKPFYVYCLKDPEGGAAWTVVQRRADNSTDFYRDWAEYKLGFGNLRNEFFIGLDKLSALTQARLQELRIEMMDFDNETRYASYDNFAIGGEDEQYALNILGAYEGNAGDSLRRQQGQKFSTPDNDNDLSDENCAEDYLGAWWYEACQDSNLNGVYLAGDLSRDQYGQGIVWNDWRGQYYSLKSVYMAIRPKV